MSSLTLEEMVAEWVACHRLVRDVLASSDHPDREMSLYRSPGGAGWLRWPRCVTESVLRAGAELNITYRAEIVGDSIDLDADWEDMERCTSRPNPHTCAEWREFLQGVERAIHLAKDPVTI